MATPDLAWGGESRLIAPLAALGRADLGLAGGKAANLGELVRAGLPTPPGFCVTTAAYARAVEDADLRASVEALAAVPPGDGARQAQLAAAIRRRILAAPLPAEVATAVRRALGTLGARAPVAVRSSATAEDLPFASFAGQQDTFLNVVGDDAVLEALRRCWASLWSDRAVSYRAANGIDQRGVRLAAVVQRLVAAEVAGVLFTANPVTGRRGEVVIDASPGLGDALVSGAVNPDHFVVDAGTGAVRERRPGDRRAAARPAAQGGVEQGGVEQDGVEQDGVEHGATEHGAAEHRGPAPCLTDGQLGALARLGRRVEAHFGAPQDLEFAFDRAGVLWLLQARPITTLFPLPDGAPRDPRDLRVYFNFNVAQGVFRPFTPLGGEALRTILASLAALAGAAPEGRAGPPLLVVAAGRLLVDATGLVRSPVGRRLAGAALSQVEARSEPLLRALLADPRLAPRPVPWRRLLPGVLRLLLASQLPLRLPAALLAPSAARRALDRLRGELATAGAPPPDAGPLERLERAEALLRAWPRRMAPRLLPAVVAGLGAFAIAGRLLGDLATPEERDAVRRALPHNPTTEMDLALWSLAQRARGDAAAAAAVRQRAPAELALAFRRGDLPPVLQRGLAAFLVRYGRRAVAEIDLGLPRWAEDPSSLLAALAGYLALADPAQAPDAQFRAAARRAEATAQALVRRATARDWWRGQLVRFLLRRGRALAGLREAPKFLLVLLLAQARSLLGDVGAELADRGRLARADDVFFLTLPEVRAALAADGADPRAIVGERRAIYRQELRRRRLPRLLLSDGTEPGGAAAGAVLLGTPASAGRGAGRARVVLDPAAARLTPGDILVAPSTDPGWTPLFLTAGGLVMEMGGAMSHGAVVAREYGIPAVVGVADATTRIPDGQPLVVDGAAGSVHLVPEPRPAPADPPRDGTA